jgi:hypothetical protein
LKKYFSLFLEYFELMKLFPLTSAQKSILISQQVYPSSPLFNIGGYAIINGEIISSVFFSAFEQLLESHPALRLKLYSQEGNFFQYIPESTHNEIKYINFSDELLPTESCMHWINQDIEKKINIIGGSLYESALLKASDTSYYWYLKLHHIIIDGFSVALIFNEICSEYAKIIAQPFLKLEKKSLNSISFLDEEIKYQQSDKYNLDKDFWTNKMKDSSSFFSFNIETENSDLLSSREELILTREEFEKINKFCKEANLSVFHYFIGALYIYIVNIFLVKDFVIGFPVHNRSDHKVKKSIGPYFNVLPLRLNYNSELTVIELMQKIKGDLRTSTKHMHFPIFDMIQALNHNGNFYNTSFSYQKVSYKSYFNENKAEIVYLKSREQMNDLDIHILDFNDNWDLKIIFDYKTTFIPREEADMLLLKFKNLLCNLIPNNSKSISEIDIFSGKEEMPLSEFGIFLF